MSNELSKGQTPSITKQVKAAINAAVKSLAQANTLLLEMQQGYPEHFFWVIGHMNAAANDMVVWDIGIAERIREARLSLWDDRSQRMDLQYLIDLVEGMRKWGGIFDTDKAVETLGECIHKSQSGDSEIEETKSDAKGWEYTGKPIAGCMGCPRFSSVCRTGYLSDNESTPKVQGKLSKVLIAEVGAITNSMGLSDEELIEIPKEDYHQLVHDQEVLRALQAAGVDNWEGYDRAISNG